MSTVGSPRVARGDVVADVELRTPTGAPARLSSVLTRRTVVPIVRYYGCMPCRNFLHQLETVRDDLAQGGVDIVGVGRAADYQATDLGKHGINFPLLLDPDEALYRAIGLGRFPWWKMLAPGTWLRYVRAAKGARQGRITNHPLQSPGVVILDPDRTAVFVFRGATIGDYPPVTDVVETALQP